VTNPLLDPELIGPEQFARVTDDVRKLLETGHDVIVFPGEAVVPLEATARSLAGPGVGALNLVTSPYGRWFGRWLSESGSSLVEIEAPLGEAIRPENVERELSAHPEISVVSLVHAEAISGLRNDAATISRIAHEHGAIVALDAVASFGADEVAIDEWGIDVVVVGPQKALAGPFGVSLVAVSERAWEAMRSNDGAPRHSSLSLLDWKSSWIDTDRSVVPVILAPLEIRALDAATSRVSDEGLRSVQLRHRASAAAARAGGRSLGLQPLVRDEDAAAIATTFKSPTSRDAREVVAEAKLNGDVALSAGVGDLASTVMRVDHTGQRARLEVVRDVLVALASALDVSERLATSLEAADAAWREVGNPS
jgi:aspartate aminotransferase-like enzyme